jgi:hypothetical protein
MMKNMGFLMALFSCKEQNFTKEQTFDNLVDEFNLTLALEQDWLNDFIEDNWETV